jgi:flagellar basal-body rod protein FlgC
MRVDSNLSALMAFGTGMAVTANNVANVNTEGFKSSAVTLETGANDQGVRVAAIEKNESAGPLIPEPQQVLNEQTGYAETQQVYVEGSNTDLAREMVNLNVYQNSYSANIAAIKAQNEMQGVVLDLKV